MNKLAEALFGRKVYDGVDIEPTSIENIEGNGFDFRRLPKNYKIKVTFNAEGEEAFMNLLIVRSNRPSFRVMGENVGLGSEKEIRLIGSVANEGSSILVAGRIVPGMRVQFEVIDRQLAVKQLRSQEPIIRFGDGEEGHVKDVIRLAGIRGWGMIRHRLGKRTYLSPMVERIAVES